MSTDADAMNFPLDKGLYDFATYAPFTRASGLIFTAGMVGIDGEGHPLPTAEAQFHAIFDRLDAVLRVTGRTWDDVVELSTFHVDMHQHLESFVAVKRARMGEHRPAWTAVGVACLYQPGVLAEAKIVIRD
jgi:enamine deaminase RidA (YjgF/YER057c/UK114 family)